MSSDRCFWYKRGEEGYIINGNVVYKATNTQAGSPIIQTIPKIVRYNGAAPRYGGAVNLWNDLEF